jgi:hypothetical protein
MSQTPRLYRNPPLGFSSNPSPDPRIDNPFLMYRLPSEKLVEILVFRGKKLFPLFR